MRLKRILFPIDFSQQCSEFGAYVAGIAKRLDAELTLLHVIDTIPLAYSGVHPAMSITAGYAAAMLDHRKKELEAFLGDQFANLPVRRVAEVGDPAAVITRYASLNDIDLIMMPTHGYGAFRRFLLGSVTAKVLHDADCFVWTSAHQAEERRAPAFREILCCVDLTPESLPLLQSASAIAARLGGELRLVHAIPAIEAATEFSRRALGTPEVMYDAGNSEVEKLLREAGVKAELCLETGSVPKVVRSAALRHHSDLVIVGRGRIDDAFGALRTNAYAVIRESPCPVLSIYSGPRREKVLVDDSVATPLPSPAMS